MTQCATFPPTPQNPQGGRDCASGTIKIEPALYVDVVVDGFVDPLGGASTAHRQPRPYASVDKCVTTYYCCYAKLNAEPANGDVRDPRSVLQTFIIANCYGGDALKSNSVTFNAFAYNDPSGNPRTKVTDAGSYKFVKNLMGGFQCATPHTSVPLVTGHAEMSRPFATVTDSLSNRDTSELNGDLDLNDKAVDYPEVDASASGYAPGIVPFPDGPFSYCFGSAVEKPPCTVTNRPKFRKALITYYQDAGWSVPPGVFASPSTYDAHHLEPLGWGGNDNPLNGVFLTNRLSTNDHQIFSTWWCNFSLPNAVAPAPCTGVE